MNLGEFLADFGDAFHVLGGPGWARLARGGRSAVSGRLRGGSFVLKLFLLLPQIGDLLLGEGLDEFDDGRLDAAAGDVGIGDVGQILAADFDLNRSPLPSAGGEDVAGVRGDLLLGRGRLCERQHAQNRQDEIPRKIKIKIKNVAAKERNAAKPQPKELNHG